MTRAAAWQRLACALLFPVWLGAALPAGATALVAEQLGTLLQEMRQRGCQGKAGGSPLTLQRSLAVAAQRVNERADPTSALREAGYRGVAVRTIQLGGHRSISSVLATVDSKFCAVLLDPSLTELGVGASGSQVTILLARPFVRSFPDLQAVLDRVVLLVNAARAQGGTCGSSAFAPATPMRVNPKLQAAAQMHATDMAQRNYYSHQSMDGRTLGDRISAQGYRSRMAAENIASGQQSADEVVAGWLKSPGHCRNILHPGLTEIGVGVAINVASDKGSFWVQNFGAGER